MNEQPARILLNGAWRPARAIGTFTAFDPTNGRPLAETFPVSSFEDAREAVQAGQTAARDLEAVSPEDLAGFLDLMAKSLDERSAELVEIAHRETALSKEPRLQSSELPRTIGQLRQAAEAVRDGSWRQATIETGLNIRSVREPLGGPVVVLGPANFPLAFNSAAGGDFAAALAAGNPVIAKAHPSHPGTTRKLAEIARSCLDRAGLPPASLQLLYHLRPEDGLRLVAHPGVAATAFTGSRRSGLALKKSAEEAGRLIYLELSGLNPVFLLPDAVKEKGEILAGELFASCSLGAGQFCTKPGLTVLRNDESGRAFVAAVLSRFQSPPSGFLLNRGGLSALKSTVDDLLLAGAELLTGGHPVPGPGYRFENTLFRISGREFLSKPQAFLKEAFGTVTLLVLAESTADFLRLAAAMEGTLGLSVYSGPPGSEDDALYNRLLPLLKSKTGRLLNDKMPTGLAVVPAMVHGGPFPATGHPGFTSVGIPASLQRFTALRCYDGVRPDRLPAALADRNPNGRMDRWIDGTRTGKDVPDNRQR